MGDCSPVTTGPNAEVWAGRGDAWGDAETGISRGRATLEPFWAAWRARALRVEHELASSEEAKFCGLCSVRVPPPFASPFPRVEVTVSFNVPPLRARQGHFTCLGAAGSSVSGKCSWPDCRMSGLFGSGADGFALVRVF